LALLLAHLGLNGGENVLEIGELDPLRVELGHAAATPRPPARTPGPPDQVRGQGRVSTSPRIRGKPGETSKRVLSYLPVGAPGVTQRDLQTRLPGIRANVIGRIVENAATHGTAIKEGDRYWRPERQSTSAAAE